MHEENQGEQEHRERGEREERYRRERGERGAEDASRMDLSYGGLSLVAKGSIVVLALINIAGTTITLWFLGQQNVHFDALFVHVDTELSKHSAEIAAMKIVTAAQHTEQVGEIDKNRLYLREIQRVCMMTPDQRLKLQQTLSPTMKELLFRGESPLETVERQQQRRLGRE